MYVIFFILIDIHKVEQLNRIVCLRWTGKM